MVSVAAFRLRLGQVDPETGPGLLVEEFLLTPGALHVSDREISLIKTTVGATYGVDRGDLDTRIVGSAKLGFSLINKERGGNILPRYRPFGPDSDIDVVVISNRIFDRIWHEIALLGHSRTPFPHVCGKLGNYLTYGWLRPDQFPRQPLACQNWSKCFQYLSAGTRMGRRSVKGGLFYSADHMRLYYTRAIKECMLAEELEA